MHRDFLAINVPPKIPFIEDFPSIKIELLTDTPSKSWSLHWSIFLNIRLAVLKLKQGVPPCLNHNEQNRSSSGLSWNVFYQLQSIGIAHYQLPFFQKYFASFCVHNYANMMYFFLLSIDRTSLTANQNYCSWASSYTHWMVRKLIHWVT